MITCIRRADWVVAWEDGRHVYHRDVDLAFDDGAASDAAGIVHLGSDYQGPADRELDGSDRLLLPGLVNVHSHPSSEPMNKGYREEFGNPLLYWSPLYDRAGLLRPDDEGRRAATELALAEMLTSGVTSVCDLAAPWPGWLDVLAGSGMRAWAVPGFASARWVPRTAKGGAGGAEPVGPVNANDVGYDWDEAAGHRALEAAIAVAERADAHPSGRLAGMLSPAQVDTCSEELIRAAIEAADEHGWRIQIHAAQSLFEFHEMTRRHGCTPIQWLDRIDALRPTTTVAHGIFLDRHSWTRWPTDLDRDLLADTGTGLAHCPVVFSRHGQAAENIGGYLRSGITVGIGTDSFPHNLLEELRTAATLGWLTTGDVRSITTGELFAAATVGGASLVGRDDLGRLAVGAAADVVSVDLTHRAMVPVRDPLRSLIYTAADRAVTDVFVAGRPVVVDGRVTTIDVDDAGRRLDEARRRAEATAGDRHHLGLAASDLSPLSLPVSRPVGDGRAGAAGP